MKYFIYMAASGAMITAVPAMAQSMDHMGMNHQTMDHSHIQSGMYDTHEHAKLQHGAHVKAQSASSEGSGTSRLPGAEGEMSGFHAMSGDWMIMAHGYLWGIHTNQDGPRGDQKDYVQSMLMLNAKGPISDKVDLTLKSMWSLEPLMSARGYPNLFATGETANGVPLIDRQHPHDLVMELAARIDVKLNPNLNLFLYGGPVGEPALGPSAFMMRRSSRYNPDAPISHHWFDSTHITYGVVTAGLSTERFQIESSAFRGREPDEERWGIETPKLDSWSIRASWMPTPQWSAQLSYGRLKSPEALHIGEDEGRMTASVHYANSALSLTGAFSAKNRLPGPTLKAWLVEGNWNLTSNHNLFGRAEVVENDELFAHGSPLHGQMFRLGKFQLGYAYRIPLGESFALALGGSASAYAKPRQLDAYYGNNPLSYTLFARFSLGN